MFLSSQHFRSIGRIITIWATACLLCFCSGMSGPGGSSPVGGANENPAGGLNAPNHAVGGGGDDTGTNPNGVPSTQESTHIIPGPSMVGFQVQVKVISHGVLQPCQPVSPRNSVTANLAYCGATFALDTGTKALGSAGNCPEPSPLVLPNAPKIDFEFTRSGADPQYATTQKSAEALCYFDGSWKAWMVFSFAGCVTGPCPENPYSAKVSASFNSDGKTFSSSPLAMPPFPDRPPDSNTIPVVLTIDLDGVPTAVAN